MIDFLNDIDSNVFLFFNGLRAPFCDVFMMLFSERFIWVPFYAVLLFLLFRGARLKAGIVFTMAIVLAITLTDQTCASIIRPAAVRLRPSNLDNPLSEFAQIVNNYRGGDYGFPSCHAANSFALAVFFALFCRCRWASIPVFAWAVVNSYSRLYLGVHYPGDLVVGGLIGALISAICFWAGKQVVKLMCIPDSSPQCIASRLSMPLFTVSRHKPDSLSLSFSSLSLLWIVLLLTVSYIFLLAM